MSEYHTGEGVSYPWQSPNYRQTIRAALKALGKKHLTLICHGASFPSVAQEDTGFGSPVSEGAKRLIEFLDETGFDSIQLGPGGNTKGIDPSPYTGTSFSNNTLFIDLHPLAFDPKWQGILSQETYNRISNENPNQGVNRTAYNYIHPQQAQALREAFDRFQAFLSEPEPSPGIRDLNERFKDFCEDSKAWLERDALYEALSVAYQNDYFPNWEGETAELDKHLFCPRNGEEAEASHKRIAELYANYADVIRNYQFAQWIVKEQIEQANAYARSKGIKFFADRQVAFTDRDLWAYQHLFMNEYFMGVPPDYYSEDGQAWGFPIMNPEKIVNPDGSLAEGGDLLYHLFKKMFHENPGGVRIDHFVGLVDPWIYPKFGNPTVAGGGARLYSSPENPGLQRYALIKRENIDDTLLPDDELRVKDLSPEQIDAYARVIKIILKAAREEGLDTSGLVCEDLGTLTIPVREVFKQYGLSGLRVTQFADPHQDDSVHRGKNVASENWVMIGSHDADPLWRWLDIINENGSLKDHATMLVDDVLHPPGTQMDDKLRERLADDLVAHPTVFAKTKLAELFVSPAQNIQVMFTDLFGMKETYNVPSTVGDQNWSLRIPNNFEDFYKNQLGVEYAMNLPGVLLLAMRSKELDKNPEYHGLITELENLEQQLKHLHQTEQRAEANSVA